MVSEDENGTNLQKLNVLKFVLISLKLLSKKKIIDRIY